VTRETGGLAHSYPRDCKAWCCGGTWNKKRVTGRCTCSDSEMTGSTRTALCRESPCSKPDSGYSATQANEVSEVMAFNPDTLTASHPQAPQVPLTPPKAGQSKAQAVAKRRLSCIFSTDPCIQQGEPSPCAESGDKPSGKGGLGLAGSVVVPLAGAFRSPKEPTPLFEPATVGAASACARLKVAMSSACPPFKANHSKTNGVILPSMALGAKERRKWRY